LGPLPPRTWAFDFTWALCLRFLYMYFPDRTFGPLTSCIVAIRISLIYCNHTLLEIWRSGAQLVMVAKEFSFIGLPPP